MMSSGIEADSTTTTTTTTTRNQCIYVGGPDLKLKRQAQQVISATDTPRKEEEEMMQSVPSATVLSVSPLASTTATAPTTTKVAAAQSGGGFSSLFCAGDLVHVANSSGQVRVALVDAPAAIAAATAAAEAEAEATATATATATASATSRVSPDMTYTTTTATTASSRAIPTVAILVLRSTLKTPPTQRPLPALSPLAPRAQAIPISTLFGELSLANTSTAAVVATTIRATAEEATKTKLGATTEITDRQPAGAMTPNTLEANDGGGSSSSSTDGNPDLLNAGIDVSPALEIEHVRRVYDTIASHWDRTRHTRWPRVEKFLGDLPPCSLVADVGCGNGKYLNCIPTQMSLGMDVSKSLTLICAERGHEVSTCDTMSLPYRQGMFDAAISIAVLHHLSSRVRRLQALREASRLLCPGGRLLATAWALEQGQESRRRFSEQDVLVPWHHLDTQAEIVPTPAAQHGQKDAGRGSVLYRRYCHVFVRGELEELIAELRDEGMVLVESWYDTSNWCVIAEKKDSF